MGFVKICALRATVYQSKMAYLTYEYVDYKGGGMLLHFSRFGLNGMSKFLFVYENISNSEATL